MKAENLFESIPPERTRELAENLLTGDGFRMERIVSRGHRSPPGFWYDQDENEWVLLLSGSARLLFGESGESLVLRPGDFIDIPARTRHRVDWTDPSQDTVWLAVFYPRDRGGRTEPLQRPAPAGPAAR